MFVLFAEEFERHTHTPKKSPCKKKEGRKTERQKEVSGVIKNRKIIQRKSYRAGLRWFSGVLRPLYAKSVTEKLRWE